jgi:DNA-binding response OmpR family regulator
MKPDLVLLDLMMPHVSGWEIYQHMQASPELCHIPVMILTVQPRKTSELKGQYFDAAAGYFTKPFRPQSLLAQVDRCLGTGQGLAIQCQPRNSGKAAAYHSRGAHNL